MFSINNLRLGTITATDYCLGSVPVQKMYLGQILVFDRTEAITTQYVFKTETGSTTFSTNAVNGSFDIQIQSYKINSDGSGREELNIMIANDGSMDWCTPSVTNSGSTHTLHLDIQDNNTTNSRTCRITIRQNESNQALAINITQAAGSVDIQYTFNFDGLGAEEDKTESITHDAQDISSVLISYKETFVNGVSQNDRTYVPVTYNISSGSTFSSVSEPDITNTQVEYTIHAQENVTNSGRRIAVVYTQSETNKTLRHILNQTAGTIDTKYTFTVPHPTISIPAEAKGGYFTLSWESYKQDVVNGEVQDAKTKVGVVTNSLEVPDWIQLSSQEEGELGNSLKFNFSDNTTASERSYTFELTQQETSDRLTVVVTQAGADIETTYTWNVTPTTVTIDGTDTATINVISYKQQWIGDIQQGSPTPVDFQYTNPGLEESIQATKRENGTGRWTITLSGGTSSVETTYQMVFTANEGDNSTTVTVNKVVAGRNYGDITITEFTYPDIAPASGSTLTPTLSYTQSWGYGDSTTDGGTITSGATLYFAGGAVNASNGQYTYTTKGTELSEQTDTQVTVTVSLNGKTKTATANASQAANTRTAVITDSEFTTAYRDFPASGMANVSWSGYGSITHAPKAEWQYTSGSKTAIEASYQWIDGTDHNIPSRDTTVGERQKVLQRDGEWYLVDQCTFVEGDLEVLECIPELWQQANEVTDTQYTEWTITQSNIDDVSAEGDTITVSPSIKRTKTDTYTSTATKQTEETSTDFTLQSNQSWAVVNGKNINVSQNTGGERSATITITSNGKSTTFTITQSTRQTITSYGDIAIDGGSATDIPASGGTVKASGCTATIQVTYSSGSTGTVTVPAQNITYTEVSAESLGTTIKARTKVGTSTCNVSYQGKSASKQIDVYQAANNATYGKPVVSCTYNDIPASGGSVNPTSSFTQSVEYTSGSTSTVSTGGTWSYTNATNTSTGQVTASSKGKTESDRTEVKTVTANITVNGKTGSKQVVVYQQANTKTAGDITYGEWQVSVSANPTSVPNSGGTSTITRSAYRSRTQNYSYTSGDTSIENLSNETATPTLSSNQTWAVISGTTVNISANNADTSRTVTITATQESKQATCTITQGASVKVYSDLNVTGLTFKQLPASGIAAGQHVAQSYVTGGKVTQTWGWNTATGGGTLTWNLPADISEFTTFDVQIADTVPSLGTTEREEHTINDIFTVNISQNGKTYNASYDGVQEANVKTAGDKRYNEDTEDTKQNVNISPASPWEFDVGTVKTKFRLGVPTYQMYTYTSGSESEEQIADTILIPDSVSFFETSTNTPVEWIHSRTAIFDDPDYEYQYTVEDNITGYSRTVDVVFYVLYPDQSLITKLPITTRITQKASPEMEYVTATVSNVVLNDAPASGISLQNYDNGGYNNVPNSKNYLKSCMVTVQWRYEGRQEIAGNFVKYYPDDDEFLGPPMIFYCQYNTDAQNDDNTFVRNIDEKGTTVSGRTQIPYYVRVQFISIDNSGLDAYGYSNAGAWYQEANQVESTTEEQGDKTVTKFEINNGTHTVNPQSGTLELQAVCSQTTTTVKTYTSGAISRDPSTNSTLKPASLESSQSWLTVPSVGSISWDSGKNVYTGNINITANNNTSTRTAEVRCYPDSSKPAVYESITITQNAKTSTESYGYWNFDEVTANTQSVTAAGGTITLSGNAKRTVTHNWSDGTQTTSTETKPLSECSVTVDNGATVSSNKTTVTIPVNQTTSAKSYTITMLVYGGGSNIKELTINQSADTYDSSDDTYGDWTVTVNASPLTIASTGGTSNITSSATRTVTHHWVSGRTTNEQQSGTPTLSGSAAGFNLSGNTLTAQSNVSTNGVQTLTKNNDLSDSTVNPNALLAYSVNSYVDLPTTASRSITITATMDTKTNTVRVTQSGDAGGRTYYMPQIKTVQYGFQAQIEESEYEENTYDVFVSVSKTNDDAFGTSYGQILNTTVTITTDYPSSKTLDLECGWTRFYIDGVPTRVELSQSNNNSSQFELTSNGKWTIS